MDRLEQVQRVSGVLRYLLIVSALLLAVAAAFAMMSPAQELITLGDGQLSELRRSGLISPAVMLAVIAPIGIMLLLGVYWLQRMFGEYQRGNFFTDGTMRCYLWLVWLKAAAFIYGMLWPLLLAGLLPAGESLELGITIEAGTLVELVVLLLIVHLLRAAQQINDENKAFI